MDRVIETLTSPPEGFIQVVYNRESTSYKKYIKIVRNLKAHEFAKDYHFPNLILIFPPGTDLHLSQVITSDMGVIQDKASCVPSLILLDALNLPRSKSVTILDACAAPGNKTTLILSGLKEVSQKARIIAFDHDKKRFVQLCDTLSRFHNDIMVEGRNVGKKSSNRVVCTVALRDFLTIDPADEEFVGVTAILVDPSCSASGLRCKRPELMSQEEEDGMDRVERLANLQAMILRHALSFPSVEVVVYSTCSVYQRENEDVVREMIESGAATGFELMSIWKKRENKTGAKCFATCKTFAPWATWESRGRVEDDNKEIVKMLKRCVRSSPEKDLTIGFFVACFKRQS